MKLKRIFQACAVVAFLAILICMFNEDDTLANSAGSGYILPTQVPVEPGESMPPKNYPVTDAQVTVSFNQDVLLDYIDENGFDWNYQFNDAYFKSSYETCDLYEAILPITGLKYHSVKSAEIGLTDDPDSTYWKTLSDNDADCPLDTHFYLLVRLSLDRDYFMDYTEAPPFSIVAGEGVSFYEEPTVNPDNVSFIIDLGTKAEFFGITPEPDPEPEVHVHNYIWTTRDDVKKLACTGCGEVIYEYATKLTGTDKVNVEMAWNCLPSDFYEVLAGAQSDVTLHYYYRGYDITLKIPAGKLLIVDGVKWYGPEFLADLYREYAVVKTWKGPASIDDIFVK